MDNLPENDELLEQESAPEETPEESEEKAPIVDEEQLLKLAQNEGLLDTAVAEETVEVSAEEVKEGLDKLSTEEQNQLIASMETLLFMSDKPVSLPKMRSTLNTEIPLAVYRQLMTRLREEFAQDHRGIEIAEVSLGFQLRTKPHMSSVLRKMVKTQPLKLSAATLEVLAVVAYKQPVTKDELDQIRGVDSGYVLRNLMEKRLVRIAGRSDLPGKPMVYGTTHEFLELFSLKDLKSLPSLHEVESMVAASEVGSEEQEQAALKDFGKMVATSDKILFDDSQIDSELETLRAEIASIRTSTDFIDEQKAQEKLQAKLAELAEQGLTLDAEGNVVPIGYVPPAPAPSPELVAQAEAAQAERHAEAVAVAEAEAAVIAENAEAVLEASSPAEAPASELAEVESASLSPESEPKQSPS